MAVEPGSGAEQVRAQARCAQILTAAADCFRLHGFHGASIAQISKRAGMSAGHIYHYFENKEAIIAAIVEQNVERFLSVSAEMRSAANVRDAMIGCAAAGVRDNLDPMTAALEIEIAAEAARNPGVAVIVRAADREVRNSLIETLRIVRRAAGQNDDEATLAGIVEVLAAMFEGLLCRGIRNPDIDQELVVDMFQRVIFHLVTAPLATAPACPGQARSNSQD